MCLDPFAGSGTTAEACLIEGSKSIAIERDNRYLRLIRQRIDRRTDTVAGLRAAATAADIVLFEVFDV